MILPEVHGLEKQIVAQLNKLFSAYSDGRQDRAERWERCFYAYQAQYHPDVKFEDGRSHSYLPFAYNATHGILAELKNNLIPFPGFFKAFSEDYQDEPTTELIEAELRYLLRQMKFPQRLRPILLQTIVYGTSPYLLTWQERRRLVTTGLEDEDEIEGGDPVEGDITEASGLIKPIREHQTTYDGLEIHPLDLFNVFYDPAPGSDDPPESVSRILRTRRSMSHLKRLAKPGPRGYRLYENLDQIPKTRGSKEPWDAHEQARATAFGMKMAKPKKDDVTLKTLYGDFELEIGGETQLFENMVITWANDKTLIRFEDNDTPGGHIPIQQLTYEDSGIPGQVLGLGALEPALGVEGLANATANQVVDAQQRAIKPRKVYDPSGNRAFDPDRITFSDEWIPSQKPIATLDSPFTLQSLVEVLGFYEILYMRATGAPQGHTMEETPRSATEIAKVAATQAGRFKEIVSHLSTQLDFLLEMILDWRREYGPEDPVQRRLPIETGEQVPEIAEDDDRGNAWYTIPPEIFDEKYTIECIGGGVMSEKSAQLAGIAQFLGALETVGGISPELVADVNTELILRRLWSLAYGRDDDDIIQVNPVKREMIGQ